MKLILHPRTRSIDKYNNKYCPVVSGLIDYVYIPIDAEEKELTNTKVKIDKGRYIKPKYKTDEDYKVIADSYGSYAIINETLKTVYVGETTVSFHNRWNQHYEKKKGHSKKVKDFINHRDTYFTILEISNGDKEETERLEAEGIQWFKDKYPEWIVLGGTYRDNCWYGKRQKKDIK